MEQKHANLARLLITDALRWHHAQHLRTCTVQVPNLPAVTKFSPCTPWHPHRRSQFGSQCRWRTRILIFPPRGARVHVVAPVRIAFQGALARFRILVIHDRWWHTFRVVMASEASATSGTAATLKSTVLPDAAVILHGNGELRLRATLAPISAPATSLYPTATSPRALVALGLLLQGWKPASTGRDQWSVVSPAPHWQAQQGGHSVPAVPPPSPPPHTSHGHPPVCSF